MLKVIGTVVGLVVGLLVSYLFKPSVPFFGTVSFTEWFSPAAFNAGYGSTIIVCGAVGAILGFVAGVFLDRKPSRPAA